MPNVQVSLRRHLPGVLRVEIQIQEIVRLGVGQRKGFRCRRGHAVDELRQGRVGDQRHGAFAEIVIVQPEDAGVGSEAELMRADGPRQIVVDEEAGRAASLHPGVVQPAEGRKGRVRAAAFEHDRKRRQRLLKIGRSEQALVPGERRIEIVHQIRRKDMRVAGGEGVERLRRDGVEQRIDRDRCRRPASRCRPENDTR